MSFLTADKTKAKKVIASLAEDAKGVKEDIQNEMVKRFGFKWDVWMGFMQHLHLHVLSADLCSEKLKHKKHYNSFHPEVGFFLPLDDVVSWFDAEPSYFANLVKQFKPKEYEAKLKEDLVCFQCNKEIKNIPTLKAHLQDEWNKRERASRTTAKRKRGIQDSEKPPTEVHAGKTTSDDAETESNAKEAKSQKIEETPSSTSS
ncbi:hypothetical protein BJ912DRAFT_945347 [Pholiota molesta]|nr:hypothetical protein BJ912DRAFT_945347 [Pholiota molesta]